VGAIAGLATVTPAAGFIQPWAAFVLGVLAAVICYVCVEVANKVGFDDALDVWGVHGMGGFLGTVLLGVLADGSECDNGGDISQSIPSYCVNPNTITRSGEQFGKQLVAAILCAVYSFLVSFVMLKVLDKIIPLKPQDGDLDQNEHGERAYTPDKPYTAETGGVEAAVEARLAALEARFGSQTTGV
jgi:Amt family ammonium transporter